MSFKATILRQQAAAIKSAYEEGFRDANTNWQQDWMDEDWSRSNTKRIHDGLLEQSEITNVTT